MNFRNSPGFTLGPMSLLILTNVILYIAVSINQNLILLFGSGLLALGYARRKALR